MTLNWITNGLSLAVSLPCPFCVVLYTRISLFPRGSMSAILSYILVFVSIWQINKALFSFIHLAMNKSPVKEWENLEGLMAGGCPVHGDLCSSTSHLVTPGLSYKSLISLLQPLLVLKLAKGASGRYCSVGLCLGFDLTQLVCSGERSHAPVLLLPHLLWYLITGLYNAPYLFRQVYTSSSRIKFCVRDPCEIRPQN